MSVNSVYIREIAQGDGVNTVFGFPWKFVAAVDLMVYIDDVLQPASTYEVKNPITKDRGEIVFRTAPAVGAVVVIRRMDNQQQTRLFKNQENFNAHEVEKAFDKLTLLVQEGFEELRRGALRMQSQSNLDYTIENLTIDDGMLALDLANKTYKQTSFTQAQVQKVIDEAVRSADYSVKNMRWDGDALVVSFSDGSTKKDTVSDNIAQIRAQHDDDNRWWLEWSLDGKVWQGVGGISGGSVHNNLIERDAPDAHPISAISGLQTALNALSEEIDELREAEQKIDDVAGFVGYTEGGKLNKFIGISNDEIDAQMGNSQSGAAMTFEDKVAKTKGTIALAGSTPRAVFESTDSSDAFKYTAELRKDGIYINDSDIDDNFVRIPTSVDLGILVKNLSINSDDASTTKLDVQMFDVQTGSVSIDQLPLPVANTNQAGIWNPSMYQGFLTMQASVNTLLSSQEIPSVDLETDSPTSAECTAAYTNALGRAPTSGVRLYNSYNSSVWLCLDGTAWVIVSGTTTNNAIATTETPGSVLSSLRDGTGYVETNGVISVVGWDAMKSSQSNMATAITELQDTVGSLDLSAYLPTAGGSMTGVLNVSTDYGITFGATTGIKITGNSSIDGFSFGLSNSDTIAMQAGTAKSLYANQSGYALGKSDKPWNTVYAGSLNNGAVITIPNKAGLLALTTDIPAIAPQIQSIVRNETTGVLTVVFSKTPTTKMAYYLATGNEIAGSWALVSGTTWKFTPSAASNILDNDWGVKCL